MLVADGFDGAIIGIARRFGQENIVAYSYERCVEILIERDGATYEEAVEHLEVNVLGAWRGEETPIFVHVQAEIPADDPLRALFPVASEGEGAHAATPDS